VIATEKRNMKVDFYQLSRDPVERVIPSIAQRLLDGGDRLLIVAADEDRLDRISLSLWSAGPDSFLAHDCAGCADPGRQPILLSPTCQPDNGARHIALADGLWRDEALQFERVFYFFDDNSVEGARQSWRTLSRQDAIEPRFWRQEGRKWVQGP
jgi:DNA polymerase III subunit chi